MDAELTDLCVIARSPSSVRVAFHVPPSSLHRRRRLAGAPAAQLDFRVSVLGGPGGDVLGPRTEVLRAAVGRRGAVELEVAGLQEDTEYSLSVELAALVARPAARQPASAASPAERVPLLAGAPGGAYLEVRTASKGERSPGAAAQWWDELGKTKEGGRKAEADEGSTKAPSDGFVDDDGADSVCGLRGAEAVAEGGAEAEDSSVDGARGAGGRTPPPTAALMELLPPSASMEVELEEPPVPAPALSCNLCWMCDLFSASRRGGDGPLVEVIAEPVRRDAPVLLSAEAAAERRRNFKPYRTPFPGVEVSAASVGLTALERSNAALMAEAVARRRAAEAEAEG